MVSAHIDTLGAMVKEIKPNGRLKVIKVGGFAWRVVEGEYCSIITRNGKKISGTLLPVFPSAHISSEHEKIEANENTMEVRIDLDVNSKDDVLNSGIMIGDYVAFEPRFAVTDSGFVKSRYLDNKINVAIVLETLNSLKDVTLPYTTHIFFNTHEEIGYGGNSNISEKVKEYLAIDIAISAIGQTSTEKSVSICAMDSSGPFDYGFVNSLMELAKNSNIEHRLDIYPYYNSDATAALASGNDLIRALIGPGVDASHSLERTHKDAILETCKLLKAYLLSEGTR
jgi:putative aminopeptidase FrvX